MASNRSENMEQDTPYHIGQQVLLVPSKGAYQKPMIGEVTSITAKQVGVKHPGRASEIRHRISDGMPVLKYHQQFPCYLVKPMPEEVKDECTNQ